MQSDLDNLGEKIRKARAGEKNLSLEEIQKQKEEENSKMGVQVGLELVGAIFIPTFLGYWIDNWLGTLPLFMISLFFLGTAAGFYNVYRITQGAGSSVGLSGLHRVKKKAKHAPELKHEENTKGKNRHG